jgi:hypothetical protein
MRVYLSDPAQPIAIEVTPRALFPYQVFANGKLVFTSPSFTVRERQYTQPGAIPLPETAEVVLAVRIFTPPTGMLHFFPISQVEIGHAQALANAAELERLHDLNESTIAGFLDALLFIALAPIPLALYFFQRSQREYLALGLFALLFGSFYAMDTALGLGVFPLSKGVSLLYAYAGWLTLLTGLEFIARFAHARSFRPIRIIQALLLLGPPLSLVNGRVYQYMLIVAIVAFLCLTSFYLVRAWRRGRTELTLLLPPVLIWAGITLYTFSAQFWPKTIPWLASFHVGPIGVSLDHVGSAIFISGVIAVVLYRFIRVSRDEERIASELEAARTVQQILIPDALPEIAGLKILSAYHPAQSVGGDFFQILPVADGGCLIVLGDVAGKGLQAAMAVSVLVGAIRTLAQFTPNPGKMLAGLNGVLYGRQTSFTTCLALHVATDGRVTAANAGHLHPYLNGRELALEPNLPLGFANPEDAAATYTETRFFLGENDTLTMLTDGVPEAANAHTRELFGFERTQTISGQTPQTIAQTAQAFGQNDDITVLSVCRSSV